MGLIKYLSFFHQFGNHKKVANQWSLDLTQKRFAGHVTERHRTGSKIGKLVTFQRDMEHRQSTHITDTEERQAYLSLLCSSVT